MTANWIVLSAYLALTAVAFIKIWEDHSERKQIKKGRDE